MAGLRGRKVSTSRYDSVKFRNNPKGTRDFFEFYTANYKKPVDFNTYRKLSMEFHEEVLRMIIEEVFDYKLPHGFGRLRVKKRRGRYGIVFSEGLNIDPIKTRVGIDMNETKKLWARDPEAKANKTRVFYENKHTDGFKYSFHWMRDRAGLTDLLALEINRTVGKHKLAEVLKKGTTNQYYM